MRPSQTPSRGLLIDLDGTLYTEGGPIPSAREMLTHLETAGIPYGYVTNTTRKSRREIARRLREFNFPARNTSSSPRPPPRTLCCKAGGSTP